MAKEALTSTARQKLSLVKGKRVPLIYPRSAQGGSNVLSDRIREARTRDEKEKLYRFRYDVTIGSVAPHADHFGKRIKDDLDVNAVNLLALHGSEIVGAVRINYAWRCALGIHADFYRMREMAGADHPSRTCVISRLIVHPDFKGRGLGSRLCAAAYKHALERDARFAFLHCKDDLIYYFSVLGFKAYVGRTWHQESGQVVPMKLALVDEKYLMRIGSPLLPILRGWKQSKQPSPEFVPA